MLSLCVRYILNYFIYLCKSKEANDATRCMVGVRKHLVMYDVLVAWISY